jgi:hypothetical protein
LAGTKPPQRDGEGGIKEAFHKEYDRCFVNMSEGQQEPTTHYVPESHRDEVIARHGRAKVQTKDMVVLTKAKPDPTKPNTTLKITM